MSAARVVRRRVRHGVAVLYTALAALAALDAAHADTLQDARQAVDARRFEQALPLFESLLKSQPGNGDLLIETARVYGFADRHREAIETYRRVLEEAPARRNDVVTALAWQLLWSGDAAAARPMFMEGQASTADPQRKAEALRGEGEACAAIDDLPCTLRAYQQAQALQPHDRDLQRRIALAWLWLDDFDMAEQAWRVLLAADPNDRRSQAGLARTLNSAGRHNAAAALYGRIDDGSDPAVRLDHARALRWAGYDAAAYSLLTDRSDADAVWLRDWRVGRELRPYVYATIEYATDRDQLDVGTATAAAGTLLTPAVLLEAGYRHVSLNGADGAVAGNRLFATLRGAVGEPGQTPPGLIIPAISLGLNDYAGWTPLTGSATVRWMPADLWRIAGEFGREVVETPLAISNRITVDSASLGLEYRLPPWWTVAGALSSLRFSDGNDRARFNGRVDYAVHFKPRVVVGVEAAAFESSLPSSFAAPPPAGTIGPQGYWNPKRYAEARAFAGITSDSQPLEWYGRVALGVSREVDGDGNASSGNPNLLELGAVYDQGPGLRWRFFAGGSGSSFAVGNGGTGYWRRYIGFNLTAWF